MAAMRLIETKVQGAFVVELDPHHDERGLFARAFCAREFALAGLNTDWVQNNISHNRHKGTVRGMHYQCPPHEEIKLVRCTAGSLYDVIVDLRPDSATYCQWFGIELSATNRKALYIPKGIAHGFQTRIDNTELYYHMSDFYHPESVRGIRWNDPVFAIEWPAGERIWSEKDFAFPDWIK